MNFARQVSYGLLFTIFTHSLLAQTGEVEVDSNFLLWKPEFQYRTQIDADIAFENAQIEGYIYEVKTNKTFWTVGVTTNKIRNFTGKVDRAFRYRGIMSYNTVIEKASVYNGTAIRDFGLAEILKTETPMSIKIDASWWDKVKMTVKNPIPKDQRKYLEVEKGGAGRGYIIVKTRENVIDNPIGSTCTSGNSILDVVNEASYQLVEALSGKKYRLSWDRPETINKYKMSVKLLPNKFDENLCDEKNRAISQDVTDTLAAESKLLYEALLNFKERKAGDVWEIDGKNLQALIHPSVKGSFTGNVIVKASAINGEEPDRLIGRVNGLKLEFLSKGVINNRTIQSSLRYHSQTVDGGFHAIPINPGEGADGEMWLNSDMQVVSFAKLVFCSERYNGNMPKIGDINANVNIKGELNFNLTYKQMIQAYTGK